MRASSLRQPILVLAGAAMVLCGTMFVAGPGVGPGAGTASAQEPAARPQHKAADTPEHPAQHPPHRPAHVILHHPTPAPAHGKHPVLRPAPHPVRNAHHATPTAVPVPVPVPVPVAPPLPPAPSKGSNTGLPLPRFASLRADAVNMRSGPGTRYPIQWVYKRRDLPVRIEREFDVWRLVEDADGIKGWVHQATLVGTRSFVVLGNPATPGIAAGRDVSAAADAATATLTDPPPGSRMLRAAPQPDGAVVAILKPGVIGRIRSCPPGSGWCRVSIRDYSGWLPRTAFWGLLSDETILPP